MKTKQDLLNKSSVSAVKPTSLDEQTAARLWARLPSPGDSTDSEIAKFLIALTIAQARAEEREACARVVDYEYSWWCDFEDDRERKALQAAAFSIRNRTEK